MVADDPDDMKTRGELKWDSQKKRFTRNQIGADNKKRIKTESGATVLASFKSDRYEKWQKKTKISIPRAGDAEVASVPVTERRYRHNNVYTPNINSKSFTRKLNSKEKELRKSGLKGKDFETAKKEYINQFQQSSNGKQELQNASQIAKALKLKDKRREKTGRHKTGKRKSR
jgi:ATP-dependent RNA helicase DDX54/DBP10